MEAPPVRYPGPDPERGENSPLLVDGLPVEEDDDNEYDPFEDMGGELKGGCDLFEFIFELAGLAMIVIATLVLFMTFYSDWQEAGIKPSGAKITARKCKVQHCGVRVHPTEPPMELKPTDTPALLEVQAQLSRHALKAHKSRHHRSRNEPEVTEAPVLDNQVIVTEGTVEPTLPPATDPPTEKPLDRGDKADPNAGILDFHLTRPPTDMPVDGGHVVVVTDVLTPAEKEAQDAAKAASQSYIFATMDPPFANLEHTTPADPILGAIMWINEKCDVRENYKLGEEFDCFFAEGRTATGALEVHPRPGWIRTLDKDYHNMLVKEAAEPSFEDEDHKKKAYESTIYVYANEKLLEQESDKAKTHMSQEYCPAAVPVALILMFFGFTLACCLTQKGMLLMLVVGGAVYLSETHVDSPYQGWLRCDLNESVQAAQSTTDTFHKDITAAVD